MEKEIQIRCPNCQTRIANETELGSVIGKYKIGRKKPVGFIARGDTGLSCPNCSFSGIWAIGYGWETTHSQIMEVV